MAVFMEENTWTIEGHSDYPFSDTHFTVGNWSRQIDNHATFHNARGDFDRGGCNLVFVDGHVEFLPRVTDLGVGLRIAWPKKICLIDSPGPRARCGKKRRTSERAAGRNGSQESRQKTQNGRLFATVARYDSVSWRGY